MPLAIKVLISVILGYLFGSVNPAYIISRIKGTDIRKEGSNNAGASNALIVFGAVAGVFCALFDIAKSYVAVVIARRFLGGLISGAAAGAACILGHIFPLFMKFKGGKGLACLGGVYLALGPKLFIICLASEMIIVLTTNYICMVSISAAVAFPALFWYATGSVPGALIFIIPAVVILLKHRENIYRIRHGVEARVSGIWDRDKEQRRVDKFKALPGFKDYHEAQ